MAGPVILEPGSQLHSRFSNDDGCGDLLFEYGAASRLQLCNAISAACFALAGVRACQSARSPSTYHYGVLLCIVALGSASFHATSSNTGFILDIGPMAVAGGMLLYAAIHVLQLHADQRGPEAEATRFGAAAGVAALAVWTPWALMESGCREEVIWGVWAVLFGSMGAFFGIVSLVIFREYPDPRGTVFQDVGIAATSILVGLLCTVHSFIPGLCSGLFTRLPFHVIWHMLSAVSALKSASVLDSVLDLVADMEMHTVEKRLKKKHGHSLCPLVVRMIKDALPSQFSM